MKAKQKQAPASAKTWIQNVPEQEMKLTSENTLSALKTERNYTSFSHDHKSFDGNVQQKLLRERLKQLYPTLPLPDFSSEKSIIKQIA